MIITRTPLRISFAGGGSDLPAYYEQEQGAVVSTAIDKYIYITVNPKFDHKIRASYSITEIVDTVDEVKHELIRESLHLLGIDHERLTYRHQGRDFRLTDVHGHVVHDIIA